MSSKVAPASPPEATVATNEKTPPVLDPAVAALSDDEIRRVLTAKFAYADFPFVDRSAWQHAKICCLAVTLFPLRLLFCFLVVFPFALLWQQLAACGQPGPTAK